MERACTFLSRTLPLGQRAYTIYCFWILDAKVAPPPHATWHVRRVGLPPALKALTCRLGAPAHPWNERAFSYPGRCRSGNAPTLYNAFWILDAKVARPPHATWYVRRVSSLPASQALTCRLGAPAHLCALRKNTDSVTDYPPSQASPLGTPPFPRDPIGNPPPSQGVV